jgi:hypothetical protein
VGKTTDGGFSHFSERNGIHSTSERLLRTEYLYPGLPRLVSAFQTNYDLLLLLNFYYATRASQRSVTGCRRGRTEKPRHLVLSVELLRPENGHIGRCKLIGYPYVSALSLGAGGEHEPRERDLNFSVLCRCLPAHAYPCSAFWAIAPGGGVLGGPPT